MVDMRVQPPHPDRRRVYRAYVKMPSELITKLDFQRGWRIDCSTFLTTFASFPLIYSYKQTNLLYVEKYVYSTLAVEMRKRNGERKNR